jgi:hypothetical protein
MARDEAQWLGMNKWLEDRETNWDEPHKDNVQCWMGMADMTTVVKWRSYSTESPSLTVRCTSHGIPKAIREKERFWLEERRKMVRGYDTTRQ